MKKTLFFNLLFLVLVSVQATAQIANEIKSYVDSTEVLVHNGRKLFIQKLTEKDDKKAREIYQYLSDLKSESNYKAFDYTENIYSNLLLGNWNTLITYMKEYDQKIRTFTYAANDPLDKVLFDRIFPLTDSIKSESEKSGLDKESQKVIELMLHIIKTGAVDEQYNHLYNAFMKEYKQSDYRNFVTKYLPRATVKGSMTFSGGSGVIAPTGNLANNFSSNAMGHFSLDFSISKVYVSLYFNGSGLHLKQPFYVTSDTDSLYFNKNESFSYVEGGLKTGYFLLRNKKFQVAPYVKIAGTTLESTRFEDPDDDDREYKPVNSFTYGPGIHAAWKLYENNRKNTNGMQPVYFFAIKADAAYNLVAKYDEKYFKGNAQVITIGIIYGIGEF
ncbi:MAG: hypothetical protein ACM3P1_02715 [Candidatus Saccharibacteria bacterium]